MQNITKSDSSKQSYLRLSTLQPFFTAVIYTNQDNQISSFFLIAMDEELYDEFGNYIGPEINDSEDESLSVGIPSSNHSFYIQVEEEEDNWNFEEDREGKFADWYENKDQTPHPSKKIQMFAHMRMQ